MSIDDSEKLREAERTIVILKAQLEASNKAKNPVCVKCGTLLSDQVLCSLCAQDDGYFDERRGMGKFVGLKKGNLHEGECQSEYYCAGCGYPVTDHDSFCRECGGAFQECFADKPSFPDGLEWPRYTDGTLVRFGDTFEIRYSEGRVCRKTVPMKTVEFCDNGEVTLYSDYEMWERDGEVHEPFGATLSKTEYYQIVPLTEANPGDSAKDLMIKALRQQVRSLNDVIDRLMYVNDRPIALDIDNLTRKDEEEPNA